MTYFNCKRQYQSHGYQTREAHYMTMAQCGVQLPTTAMNKSGVAPVSRLPNSHR